MYLLPRQNLAAADPGGDCLEGQVRLGVTKPVTDRAGVCVSPHTGADGLLTTVPTIGHVTTRIIATYLLSVWFMARNGAARLTGSSSSALRAQQLVVVRARPADNVPALALVCLAHNFAPQSRPHEHAWMRLLHRDRVPRFAASIALFSTCGSCGSARSRARAKPAMQSRADGRCGAARPPHTSYYCKRIDPVTCETGRRRAGEGGGHRGSLGTVRYRWTGRLIARSSTTPASCSRVLTGLYRLQCPPCQIQRRPFQRHRPDTQRGRLQPRGGGGRLSNLGGGIGDRNGCASAAPNGATNVARHAISIALRLRIHVTSRRLE
jgi:hypothetical protein